MTTPTYTPMMEQYRSIKAAHPNEILFFRLGDFYEMFFDDAELASKELEITLTSRDGGTTERIPMCGVPYHSAEGYIAKLIKKGFRVAICEQVEDPKSVKGLVRREVIKVITPGTAMSEPLLEEKTNQYIVALHEEREALALVAADVSTGECVWALFSGRDRLQAVCDQLFRLQPAELVALGTMEGHAHLQDYARDRLACCWTDYLPEDCLSAQAWLAQHFSAASLPTEPVVRDAVAFFLDYLHHMLKTALAHVNQLQPLFGEKHLQLDATALRNLEITRNMKDGGKKDTLLGVLDFTRTAMGGRCLKKWLEAPLYDRMAIRARQEAVQAWVESPADRQAMAALLERVYDMERILSRLAVGSANARDLASLRASLAVLPAVREHLLKHEHIGSLRRLSLSCSTHTELAAMLANALVDNPPFSVREGGMIRDGYNLELDEIKSLSQDSQAWLQQFEQQLKLRAGIKSLKVGYNRVFGYYIEVTKANSDLVPDDFVRKQTLANAERYITQDLKEYENRILGAKERLEQLEFHLFNQLCDQVREQLAALQQTAGALGMVDALLSLAEAAARYQYVCPELNDRHQLQIQEGRHPVVERLLKKERFVPNDTRLDQHEQRVMIITGPNMAGKSTYMRQVALLVIMAQVGSFIPAKAASLCPVERIFTRVGASDDLATGQSTFMVEMNEVAQILHHADANSLVILDEVGRGTSTYDGMSIASAVLEYLTEKVQAKTLFATHYHELMSLAERYPAVKNHSVAVKEKGNDVLFLRRIVAGGTDRSYGIHVAQLAGLPKKVIERAQANLDRFSDPGNGPALPSPAANSAASAPVCQATLFSSTLAEELLSVDVMTTTPLEALNLLYKLQQQAKQEAGQL